MPLLAPMLVAPAGGDAAGAAANEPAPDSPKPPFPPPSLAASNEAPQTPAATAAGGAEDSTALTALSLKLDRCLRRVLGGAVLKLVTRVKRLEGLLQQRKRRLRDLGDDSSTTAAGLDAETTMHIHGTSTTRRHLRKQFTSFVFAHVSETIPVGVRVPAAATTIPAGSSVDAAVHAAAAPSSSIPTPADKGKTPMVDDSLPANLLSEQERAQAESVASPTAHAPGMSDQRHRELDAAQLIYTEADWLDLLAKIATNSALSKQLLGDDVTKENMNERLGMLLLRKRRELVEQSWVKPMTKIQQRDYMRDFLKNSSASVYNQGWTMKKVKELSIAQLRLEFEYIQKHLERSNLLNFRRSTFHPKPTLDAWKQITDQQVLFDKMSVQMVELDKHIINPDFKKIDSPFQQTSSLKPYVLNVILEKIIIDLEDEVVNLLEKEKVNLETIESLKSKSFKSSEKVCSELENQGENDCLVIEKECDKKENPKVIAPGIIKLNVSQCVSPISMSKSSCDSKNVEIKLKRKRHTFSSVRRSIHRDVIWRKKGSSNISNVVFPPSKTINLRNEIMRFQQIFNESFYEAWERFNDLLRACPHPGFSELHQLDTFYNALNVNDQDSLNSAAGGNFLDNMPRECLKIIESKSKVRQSQAKAVVAKVGTSSSTPAISSDVAELKDMVKALLLDKKNQSLAPTPSTTPAPVKAVEPNCVTCGGAHSYQNYPATHENAYRDNIQEYVSQAAAANYNQGNTGFRP
nr:reverse transcriptase domain-containing protein [Tanacetum cinerariifolium]